MSTIYSCVIGLLFFYFACYFFLACLASFFVPNELALLLLYQVLRGAWSASCEWHGRPPTPHPTNCVCGRVGPGQARRAGPCAFIYTAEDVLHSRRPLFRESPSLLEPSYISDDCYDNNTLKPTLHSIISTSSLPTPQKEVTPNPTPLLGVFLHAFGGNLWMNASNGTQMLPALFEYAGNILVYLVLLSEMSGANDRKTASSGRLRKTRRYRTASADTMCVFLHIKPFFLPVDIQHTPCPYWPS